MTIKREQSKTRRRNEQSPRASGGKWVLRLYVAGQTPKSVTAFNNLKLVSEGELKGKYHSDLKEQGALKRE